MRLGQHLQTGESAGMRKPVPHGGADWRQASGLNQRGEEPLECFRVPQGCDVTRRRVDDPLDADLIHQWSITPSPS
jgi:hypothetical protein